MNTLETALNGMVESPWITFFVFLIGGIVITFIIRSIVEAINPNVQKARFQEDLAERIERENNFLNILYQKVSQDMSQDEAIIEASGALKDED